MPNEFVVPILSTEADATGPNAVAGELRGNRLIVVEEDLETGEQVVQGSVLHHQVDESEGGVGTALRIAGDWQMPNGISGVPYDQTVSATSTVDEVTPITYEVLTLPLEGLPPGITLNSGSNIAHIQGTPTESNAFTFTIRATQGDATADLHLTLSIDAP